MIADLSTTFEDVGVATIERAEDGRFGRALACVLFSIPIHESFITTFHCTLELDVTQIVLYQPIYLFWNEHLGTFDTVFGT